MAGTSPRSSSSDRYRSNLCHTGPGVGLFEPLGADGGAGVDAHQVAGVGSVVREFVRGAGGSDDDIAGAGGELLVIELEGEHSFVDDPDLVVGVAVQSWPL